MGREPYLTKKIAKKRRNETLIQYVEFDAMFPQQPDPKLWEDDGRKFLVTVRQCKICNHPKRGLIEDLIVLSRTHPKLSDYKVVEWATFHKLGLGQTNVRGHRVKHMDIGGTPQVDVAKREAVVLQLHAMSDIDKLDVVVNKAFEKVITGEKPASVADGLRAIQLKTQIPREKIVQEFLHEQVVALKKKRALESAEEVEGEVVGHPDLPQEISP